MNIFSLIGPIYLFIYFNLKTTVLEDGEGNGTPLQYSCLENPMDGGTWQAAVHRVARNPTRLRAGGTGGKRGLDGWMALLTQWT